MATNEFKAFATGAGANVITQAEYEALASLASGFSAGTARSNELNKVWRQASVMAAVLAQLIVDQTGHDALDDGTTSALLENLKSAIQGLGSAQPASTTVAGIIEIATNAEHVAGASGGLAATPAGIAAVLQGTMMTYVVGGGSANAHTAMYAPEITALSDGMTLRFRATAENTGAATFSPNGMAAKPILSASLSALTGGEIKAGSEVWLQYSSVAESWIIVAGNAVAHQPLDATLTALAAVATAADKLIYATGADAFATTSLTAFARTLLAGADALAARNILGTLGDNQAWQDLTASRALGTTYTNTTGRPIAISVYPTAASSKTYTLTVAGVVVDSFYYGSATVQKAMQAIVPPGATYRVDTNSGTLSNWMELR